MSAEGDMHSPTCRLLLQTVEKNCHTASLEETADMLNWVRFRAIESDKKYFVLMKTLATA
jgi:hypothetical protein